MDVPRASRWLARAPRASAPDSGSTQGARLGFISAKLSYALAGRTRIAKLRTRGITTGSRAMLRLTLPDRLARKLRLGQRVMLRA